MDAPVEPWAHSFRVALLVFGAVLLLLSVAPAHIEAAEPVFSFIALTAADDHHRLVSMLFAVTGLAALAVGLSPLPPAGRGAVATALGLVAVFLLAAAADSLLPRDLLYQLATVVLAAGLLVRSQYRSALAGRVLVTLGALVVTLVFLVPEGGAIPLTHAVKEAVSATGRAKAAGLVAAGPFVLAILALTTWLPAASSAAPHLLAWIVLLWLLVAPVARVLAAPDALAAVQGQLLAVVWKPTALMAWITFSAYGIATVVGKNLERT